MAALIMTVFGGVWCTLALISASPTPAWAVILVVAVTMTLAGFALLAQRRAVPLPEDEQHRVSRLVGRTSAAQGLAIPMGIGLLNMLHRGEYIAPLVALLAGLHFLPLARWLPAPAYYLTGGAFLAVAAIGASTTDPAHRNVIVGMTAGSLLWLTSAWALVRHVLARPG